MTQTSNQGDRPSGGRIFNGNTLFLTILIAGILLTGFFGLRLVRSYQRIHHTPREIHTTDVEAIRNWMTIPYISRVYGVPEELLFAKLGIPQTGNRDKSLGRLSRQVTGSDPADLMEILKEAIREYQAAPPLDRPHRPPNR